MKIYFVCVLWFTLIVSGCSYRGGLQPDVVLTPPAKPTVHLLLDLNFEMTYVDPLLFEPTDELMKEAFSSEIKASNFFVTLYSPDDVPPVGPTLRLRVNIEQMRYGRFFEDASLFVFALETLFILPLYQIEVFYVEVEVLGKDGSTESLFQLGESNTQWISWIPAPFPGDWVNYVSREKDITRRFARALLQRLQQENRI